MPKRIACQIIGRNAIRVQDTTNGRTRTVAAVSYLDALSLVGFQVPADYRVGEITPTSAVFTF